MLLLQTKPLGIFGALSVVSIHWDLLALAEALGVPEELLRIVAEQVFVLTGFDNPIGFFVVILYVRFEFENSKFAAV